MNVFLRQIGLCLAGFAFATATAAHEGHDHGAEPTPTVKVLPRAQAQSADFELVAVAHADRIVLHLDRFATNEPVKGAKLEVDVGSRKLAAAERGDGTYDLAFESGNSDVCHVLDPIVTRTRTEPKPRWLPRVISSISSASSNGNVTKCHAASPGYSHSSARNR